MNEYSNANQLVSRYVLSDRQKEEVDHATILDALPHPVIKLAEDNFIVYSNQAAENFFSSSSNYLRRHKLDFLVPFGSPVLALVQQAREENTGVHEHKVDISSPRIGDNKSVDIFATPMDPDMGEVVVVFMQRTIAEKIDRQLTHRNAARSVTSLAAMLAHEVKNPLAGIRGAAQLLEHTVEGEDSALARLIMDEADRIVKIVNRMEVFSDERPINRSPVNIHKVLERVRRVSENGFARSIPIREKYDPSLPAVMGNFDQLVQVFINLVKNAAEALDETANPEITLSTAFRPGILFSSPSSGKRLALPLEITVADNGPGIVPDLQTHIFDPFVTGKVNGSGLGLALVAKIVGDHGGVIEFDSSSAGTQFKVLMPTCCGGGGDVEE